MSNPYKGAKVVSRDGKSQGVATGSTRHCQLAGCTGVRLVVRWPKPGGACRFTYPCTKDMLCNPDGSWRIL
jgi:hypothetical protein